MNPDTKDKCLVCGAEAGEPCLTAGVTTPPTLTGVPNKPKTPVSGFRIPEDLKAKAQAKAEAEGKTLTEVVVKALERYVRRG